MLTLFPFEAAFYNQHQVPVCYVGHPLAKQFPKRPQTTHARQQLGLHKHRPTLCIMPGSRASEVELMTEIFLDTATQVSTMLGEQLQLVIPAANAARYDQLQDIIGSRAENLTLINQQSHLAMEAADVVLLTSGTTALEAMLLKKPMVVGYRMNSLSFRLLYPMLKTAYISLPNLLADKKLVPELIQDHASVKNLSTEVFSLFKAEFDSLVSEFDHLHDQLSIDSSALATSAIAELISGGQDGR